MAARTAKLAKRMETIRQPYVFDDRNPVAILSFLGQFKKACDSNGVSKDASMWLLQFYLSKASGAP